MALRIWLPLNGDVINKGVDGAGVASSTTSLTYGTGKTSTQAWNSSSGFLTIPYNYSDTNQITIAFWIKPNTPNAWSDVFSFGSSSNRFEKSESTQYIWYANNSNTLITSGTGLVALGNLTWNHVALVANGSTVKIYLNGALSKTITQAATVVTAFGDLKDFYISTRDSSGGNRYYSFLNDFRVYDNALSAKEVKLLSQGLVAHYQLKGMGKTNYLAGSSSYTESNPLIRNANDSSVMADSYIYHNDIFSVTIPTDGIYSFVLNCDGTPSGHVTSGTTGSSRRFSMWL